MDDVTAFGGTILVVALAFSAAIASRTVSERLSIPAPGVFLVAAAAAGALFHRLELTPHQVEQIGTVALILILFDGGMQIGWADFRRSAWPIGLLGIPGTFATAGALAVAAHVLLGLGWGPSALLGAALAPTDPAVLFSVLGNREIGGRSGTILEGESGANDPVGIALMLGVIAFVTDPDPSLLHAGGDFLLQLGVGIGGGVLGGLLLRRVMRRSLPGESLYPLRTLAAAGVIYGAVTVAHGSGFLAVFVAGVLVGDTRAPYKSEVERFHGALAGIAEIVVFVALGLTVDLDVVFHDGLWLEGLLLAFVLAVVIRPPVILVLLLRANLQRGEKLFVGWFGLKGAVPILLAAFAVSAAAPDAGRVYALVFVVVLVSVLVQGTTVEPVAARLSVPLRQVEAEPWDLSVRLAERPRGVRRLVVAPGSPGIGVALAELPLPEGAWVSMILRGGGIVPARGDATVAEGDELLLVTDGDADAVLARLFGGGAAP